MARRFPKPVKFNLTKPEKYIGDADNIIFRSSWEIKFGRWCEANSSVVQWNSEGVIVPYFSRADNKMRRYYIDFIVKLRTADGTTKTFMVEIKPESQTKPPKTGRGRSKKTVLTETYNFMVNTDKWEAAHAYGKKAGMEFIVLSERELGIVK